MYHAVTQPCSTKESIVHNIKTVGKSGQISLGKAMAGMGFIVQELPGGDIVLKRAVVVPMSERLLDPAVHAELKAAREWRRSNPAKATDLAALGSKLGIKDIGLFGSYARNDQSEKSDIDILIDFDPEMENYDNYMAVYDIFESIFKNERIEIVTKNGLSPYIGPKILKEVMYV